jgi:hypothetical protein
MSTIPVILYLFGLRIEFWCHRQKGVHSWLPDELNGHQRLAVPVNALNSWVLFTSIGKTNIPFYNLAGWIEKGVPTWSRGCRRQTFHIPLSIMR